MNSLSPEQLFLRYTSACLNFRYSRGLILGEDYLVLEHCALEGGDPPRALLEKCFPDDAKSIASYAEAAHVPAWSMEAVASYWREHHAGESPVLRGTVVYVYSDPQDKIPFPTYKAEVLVHSTVKGGGEAHVLTSLFEHSLRPGDEVTIRLRLIIEKLPK